MVDAPDVIGPNCPSPIDLVSIGGMRVQGRCGGRRVGFLDPMAEVHKIKFKLSLVISLIFRIWWVGDLLDVC